jgi:hypothetical protein
MSSLKGFGFGYEQASTRDGAACKASNAAIHSQDDVFIMPDAEVERRRSRPP